MNSKIIITGIKRLMTSFYSSAKKRVSKSNLKMRSGSTAVKYTESRVIKVL